METDDDVINALCRLGVGPHLSPDVLTGCEKFMCQLFRPGYETAKALRWNMFKTLKPNQGVGKLCPTSGAVTEHILRAHWQANVWAQDTAPAPKILDALSLGWRQIDDGQWAPVLSKLPPAPEAVVELVKCSCLASQCSRRCSCKSNNLPCTQLCRCEGSVS